MDENWSRIVIALKKSLCSARSAGPVLPLTPAIQTKIKLQLGCTKKEVR